MCQNGGEIVSLSQQFVRDCRCGALAQSKYMTRHNAVLKVIFYELLKDLDQMTSIPPWYSQNIPKPLYENEKGKAFWDVPLYAEYAEVINNRIDCTVIEKKKKKVVLLEMSCPWLVIERSSVHRRRVRSRFFRHK